MKNHVPRMISSLKGLEVHMNLHTLSHSNSPTVWCDKKGFPDTKLELCFNLTNVTHKKGFCCGILEEKSKILLYGISRY